MKNKIYILTYFTDVPIYVGYIEYCIIASNLKEAKNNVKHKFTHYEFVKHKVIKPTTKHQFKTIFNEKKK